MSARRVAASFLVLGAFVLTGCGLATETGATPSPTATGTESPAPLDAFPFDAALGLGPSSTIRWADTMAGDDAYSVASADDGSGRWSYLQTATGCIIGFWQTQVSNLDLTEDERTLSDTMLAKEYGTGDLAELTKYAFDDALPVQGSGSGTVRVRTVVSTNDENGASSIVSARVFRTAGVGLLSSVDCPAGQEAKTVRDQVAPVGIRMTIVPGD